jgi:hypothetical protein
MFRILPFACLSVLTACTGRSAPAVQECPDGWLHHTTADAAVSLCLPGDFVQAGDDSWVRPAPAKQLPTTDFFSVKLFRLPADSGAVSSWPPSLGQQGPCTADCLAADSVTVHQDTLPGALATTTTGLISGGIAGFNRRPTVISGWVVNDRLRVLAQGWSHTAATLDTLRRALRTITLRP